MILVENLGNEVVNLVHHIIAISGIGGIGGCLGLLLLFLVYRGLGGWGACWVFWGGFACVSTVNAFVTWMASPKDVQCGGLSSVVYVWCMIVVNDRESEYVESWFSWLSLSWLEWHSAIKLSTSFFLLLDWWYSTQCYSTKADLNISIAWMHPDIIATYCYRYPRPMEKMLMYLCMTTPYSLLSSLSTPTIPMSPSLPFWDHS